MSVSPLSARKRFTVSEIVKKAFVQGNQPLPGETIAYLATVGGDRQSPPAATIEPRKPTLFVVLNVRADPAAAAPAPAGELFVTLRRDRVVP